MVRTMMRSMMRSMVRSVSQWCRSGWSVSSVSRLRVDRGSLVSHVGNESALEHCLLFWGILKLFAPLPSPPSYVLYCNVYNLIVPAVIQPRRSFKMVDI